MPPKFPVHTMTSEPVLATIAKEAKAAWPFLIGFGVTGALYLNVALGVTDEDVKKSKFTNPYQH